MGVHQVIFSIGTNIGDRLAYLQEAVFAIQEQIGTIKQVSSVFETSSWGFDSMAFYNIALVVDTVKKPNAVLDIALSIEKQLGRKRHEGAGYEPRPIDIDLISYDNLVLESEKLTLPHPLMHKRKFVLVPMMDLEIDWKHPVYAKTLVELLQLCGDDEAEIVRICPLQR